MHSAKSFTRFSMLLLRSTRKCENVQVRFRGRGMEVSPAKLQAKFEKQLTKMAAHKHGIPVTVNLCGGGVPTEVNLVIRKKKPRRMSVDKERNVVLAATIFPYISDIINSGELGDNFANLNLKLTRLEVASNFSALRIFWYCDSGDVAIDEILEAKLRELGNTLREALVQASVLPSVPPVVFVLDKGEQERRRFEEALASIDLGPDYATEAPVVPEKEEPVRPPKIPPWLKNKSKISSQPDSFRKADYVSV